MSKAALGVLVCCVSSVLLFGHAPRLLASDLLADQPFDRCLDAASPLAAGKLEGSALLDVSARGREGREARSRARLSWMRSSRDTRVRLEMLAPADVAGSSLLLVEPLDSAAAEREVWAWLPEIRAARRIGGRHLASPLFGTNLRYADLERLSRLAGSGGPDAWSESEHAGRPVWKLLSRDGAETIVTWLDRESCMPLRSELLDRKGRLSRWLELSFVAGPDSAATSVPRALVVRDVVEGSETRVGIESIDEDGELRPIRFDPAFLGRELEVAATP